PIMVSVTIETTGTMLLGTSIEGAATALAGYPILSLGLNCATGPTEMSEHVHWLGKHWGAVGKSARYVSVMPNAGLPILVDGRTEYPLTPQPFADAVLKFVQNDGVRIIGGCCGTTPEHIAQVVEGVRSVNPPTSRTVVPMKPGVTSLYGPVEYRQDNSFLIVGERMNASGSKKFK